MGTRYIDTASLFGQVSVYLFDCQNCTMPSIIIWLPIRAPIVDRADVKGCIQKLSSYVRREDDLGLNEVDDLLLKRLLQSMLAVDPSRRPGINFVLSSLYFLAP